MSKTPMVDELLENPEKVKDVTNQIHDAQKEGMSLTAYKILKDPNLFENVIKEFGGPIAGESDTVKAIFLIMCGIWVKNRKSILNALINSESSAGKSYLCKCIYNIFPELNKVYRTKISPEAFTYWHNSKFEPEWTWNGKILYLEDVKEDLLNADTFKVMCSEGSVATVVKNQRAIDIFINGKPIIMVTTASTNPNNEILNRFSLINLDESQEQTRRVLIKQGELAMGGFEGYDEDIVEALGYLKPIRVEIPFANTLATLWDTTLLNMRRDYPKFLDLIKCSAALHQFQREKDEKGRIIPTEQDYNIAQEVLIKIKESGGYTGLTHKLKKAYFYCQQLNEKQGGFTAKEIHAFAPFVADRNWYRYLDVLTSKNLLKIQLEERENSTKKVQVFYPIFENGLSLPSYKKIMEKSIEIGAIDRIDINDINDTNDNEVPNEIEVKGVKPPQKNIAIESIPSNTCSICGLRVYPEDYIGEYKMCLFCYKGDREKGRLNPKL